LTCWELADALKFLAAIREDRLYAMWLVFLTTGMRRGEVAGLRWKDVNVDAGRIAVRNQRTCVNHEVVTNDPKSPNSSATISIETEVVTALRQHRLAQKEERLLAGPGWEDTGYVFVEPDGQPYHPQRITRIFRRVAAAAGVPDIRLHDLRHTCATLLIEAGIPLKVVQERLRHASFATTADLYAHISETMQQEAARTIESLLVVADSASTSANTSQ
jgi:integrase